MLVFDPLRVVSYIQVAPLAISAWISEEGFGDSFAALFIPRLVPILSFFPLNAMLFMSTLSLGWSRLCDSGILGGLTFLVIAPLGALLDFIMVALPSQFPSPAPSHHRARYESTLKRVDRLFR